MNEQNTAATETTPATPATPETKAKKPAADRTIYTDKAAAEAALKARPAGKIVLRVRPVYRPNSDTPAGYTLAADSFTAVYNLAHADGYRAGEPDSKPADATALSDEQLEAELARRKAAKAAAGETPAAEQQPAAPEQPAEQSAPEAPKGGRGRRGK